jgi:hypothetical protein
MAMLRKESAMGVPQQHLCSRAPKTLAPLLHSELGLLDKNQKTDGFSETAVTLLYQGKLHDENKRYSSKTLLPIDCHAFNSSTA